MAVQFRDYYETLGVSKTATEDEILSAFRNLARKYHPDVAKDKKVAEEKFKQINEAYQVLSDPEKRKKYDELGADWEHGATEDEVFRRYAQAGGPEFGGATGGFSDFFERFFGNLGGGLGGGPSRGFQQFDLGDEFAGAARI